MAERLDSGGRSIRELVAAINAVDERHTVHAPIDEQVAIIEADPGAAHLVAAGAGSGKTETMSLRALWLVANGHVRPHELLGLTFTRKAAGELSERMRRRIRQLRRAGLVPSGGRDSEGASDELLDAPRVATYNSFATQLYREHAALVGRDPDAAVLSEAGAWLLARDVVRRSELGLEGLDRALGTITSDIVALARLLGDNVADPGEVAAWAEGFAERLLLLPEDGTKKYDEPVQQLAARIGSLPVLTELAVAFRAEKRRLGLIEYSDQVTIALDIARGLPEVGEEFRTRYGAVILDEYQDTSFVQTELLATLFAGHPVMAVGDPHQSIYGWRGASSANLADFGARFGADGPRLTLATSWRNDRAVLDAANALLVPLVEAAPVSVDALVARPTAQQGRVDAVYAETIQDEARETADWLAARLAEGARRDDDTIDAQPTAALLLRSWKHLPVFRRALREAGLPVQILGGGGLLAEPAVADLVAALAVVDDPGAGNELIRLLSGSRWRVGAADLAALRALADWQAQRDLAQYPVDDEVRRMLRDSVVAEDGASLVDALDLLAGLPDGHAAIARAGFSEEGRLRLREAGELFARLRRRPRFGLAELATVVIQEFGLDIEVMANDSRPSGMRVFEPFFEAIAGFEQLSFGTGLGAFLSWLREAAQRDRLSGPVDAQPLRGGVQVLTIHGAKGLEWDFVSVPRLVEDELPGRPGDKESWLQTGSLPYAFRGDRAQLPDFDWRSPADRRQLLANRSDYDGAERDRQLAEARRLAYVAVTRARRGLLVSGSWWATQEAALRPSLFLADLVDAGVIDPLPEAPVSREKVEIPPEEFLWPRDPLGRRRARVEEAARLVEAAGAASAEAGLEGAGRYAEELALLLAERDAEAAGAPAAAPPVRIPASRFHEYLRDPAAVLAALRRPMPERPFRATRRGTEFHSWAERLFSLDGYVEELDLLDDVGADDLETQSADDLARLRERFLTTGWPERRPIEVECEIDLPFAGRVVICRIDAVFPGRGDPARFEIVDWKTGRVPEGAALERKQLQLALYRLAYSTARGIDPALIDASFYYVEHDEEIRADGLPGEEELLRRWRAAFPEA